jgi:hypothetical protein
METAVQVLIALLDYGYPIKLSNSSSEVSSQSVTYISSNDVEAQGFNIFRKLLSGVDSPDQLNFIFRGFSRLLNNVHQSESSYLPYSVTRISIEQVSLLVIEFPQYNIVLEMSLFFQSVVINTKLINYFIV